MPSCAARALYVREVVLQWFLLCTSTVILWLEVRVSHINTFELMVERQTCLVMNQFGFLRILNHRARATQLVSASSERGFNIHNDLTRAERERKLRVSDCLVVYRFLPVEEVKEIHLAGCTND